MRLVVLLGVLVCAYSLCSAAITSIALTGAGTNPSAASRYTTADVSLSNVELTITSDTEIQDPSIDVTFEAVSSSQSCPATKSFACIGGPGLSFTCSGSLPAITAAEFFTMSAICKVSLSSGPSTVFIGNALQVPVASAVASATQAGSNVSLVVTGTGLPAADDFLTSPTAEASFSLSWTAVSGYTCPSTAPTCNSYAGSTGTSITCFVDSTSVDGCWLRLESLTRSTVAATGAATGNDAFRVISVEPSITFDNTTEYFRDYLGSFPSTIQVSGSGFPTSATDGGLEFFSPCKSNIPAANIENDRINQESVSAWTSTGITASLDFFTQTTSDLPDGCPLFARVTRLGFSTPITQVGRELGDVLIASGISLFCSAASGFYCAGTVSSGQGVGYVILNSATGLWTLPLSYQTGKIKPGMRFLCAPTNNPMEIGTGSARCTYTFGPVLNFDQTTITISTNRNGGITLYFNGTTTTRNGLPSAGGTSPIGTLIWPVCALDSSQNFTSGVATSFTINAGTNCTLPANTGSLAMPVPVYIDFESDGPLSTCGSRLSVTPNTCSVTGLNQPGRPSGSNIAMSCPLTVPATYDGCKVKGTISKISSFITASWYLGYVITGTPTINAAIIAVPFDTNWTASISGSHLPRGHNSEEAVYEWSTSCGVALNGCPNATYSALGTSLKCNFTTPITEGCRISVKISRRGLQSETATIAVAVSAPHVVAPPNQVALSSSPYVLFDIVTPDIVVSEITLKWQLDSCGALTIANLGLSDGPLSQCQTAGNSVNCTLDLSSGVEETCVLRVQVTRFGLTSNNPDVTQFTNGVPFGTFPSNQYALANRLVQFEIQGKNLPLASEAAQS